MLYKIPEERVLHIHGRSSKHERLIYGHNKFLYGSSMSYDDEQVSFELNKYHKTKDTQRCGVCAYIWLFIFRSRWRLYGLVFQQCFRYISMGS